MKLLHHACKTSALPLSWKPFNFFSILRQNLTKSSMLVLISLYSLDGSSAYDLPGKTFWIVGITGLHCQVGQITILNFSYNCQVFLMQDFFPFFCSFETGFPYLALNVLGYIDVANLEITEIYQPLLPECLD